MNSPVSKAERLSALVDSETDAFESRRLIDELLKSEADRRQWSRYHLIGDSLRGGMARIAPKDFLAGVQRGIADDQPLQPSAATPGVRRTLAGLKPSLLKPVAGLGVAAAVAMVTLVGLQMVTGSGEGPPRVASESAPVSQVVESASLQGAGPVQEVAPGSGSTDSEASPGPDPRFARYLENHAELLTPGSSAFARVRNSVDGEWVNGQ